MRKIQKKDGKNKQNPSLGNLKLSVWQNNSIVMWACHICLDIDRRVASFAKPICHMGCAGMSQKCPLLYPSIAAFDYLAVAVLFPSSHYFWHIIMKMTPSQCELLSTMIADAETEQAQDTYSNTTVLCSSETHTHRHHITLTVWAGLCCDWNVRINGYLYFIMSLYWPQNNVSLSGRYWNICQPLSSHTYNSIRL